MKTHLWPVVAVAAAAAAVLFHAAGDVGADHLPAGHDLAGRGSGPHNFGLCSPDSQSPH